MKDECKTDEKKCFNLFKKIGTLLKSFWGFLKMIASLFPATITFHSVLFLILTLIGYGLAFAGIVYVEIFLLADTCTRVCFLLSSCFLIIGLSVRLGAPLRIKSRSYSTLESVYQEENQTHSAIKSQSETATEEHKTKRNRKQQTKGSWFLQKHGISTSSKILIACLIIAIFISFIPFVSWGKWYLGILDVIRRTMQTLIVDGGINDLVGNKCSVNFYVLYSASLWTVGAVVIAFNIVTLLAKEFTAHMSYWVCHKFSHIFVFSELNDKSVTIAESIFYGYFTQRRKLSDNKDDGRKLEDRYRTLYEKGKPRFFFCDAYSNNSEEFSELIARAWRIGAVIMKRDIIELNVKKWARKNTFFLIAENEEENVEQAQKICRLNDDIIDVDYLRVYVYASGSTYEKMIDLINTPSKNVVYRAPRIRRIDEHNRLALDFFWNYGASFFERLRFAGQQSDIAQASPAGELQVGENAMSNVAPVEVRVAFLGFGEYANELLKVLCYLGQLPKCRLIIYIFDKDKEVCNKVSKNLSELLNNRVNKNMNDDEISCVGARRNPKYHDVPYYEIYFRQLDVENSEELVKCCLEPQVPFTHFIVCLGNDTLNFETTTYLCQKLQRSDQPPFIYATIKNGELYSDLRKDNQNQYSNRYFFGSKRERYAYWTIEEEELENQGTDIHAIYFFQNKLVDLYKSTEEPIQIPAYLSSEVKSLILETFNKVMEDFRQWIKDIVFEKLSMEDRKALVSIGAQAIEIMRKNAFYQAIMNSDFSKEDKDSLESIIKKEILDISEVRFAEPVKKIGFDSTLGEKSRYDLAYAEFNRREYFRRSSKSRVLYEKLLFQLGYLQWDGKNLFIQNLISDYGVRNEKWSASTGYQLTDSPFYSVYRKIDPNLVAQYSMLPEEDDTKINGQYFELYNLLQKRWMVFRWGEGYIACNDEEANHEAKTHPYLKPYVEIFKIPYAKLRHTLPIIYTPPIVESKKRPKTRSKKN